MALDSRSDLVVEAAAPLFQGKRSPKASLAFRWGTRGTEIQTRGRPVLLRWH